MLFVPRPLVFDLGMDDQHISAYFPVRCSHEFCGRVFRASDAHMMRQAWIDGGPTMTYARLWRDHQVLQQKFKRQCCRSTLENYGCPDVWQSCYDHADAWQPANMMFDRFIQLKDRTHHDPDKDGMIAIRANRATDPTDTTSSHC